MRQREFTSGKLEIKFGLCGTVWLQFHWSLEKIKYPSSDANLFCQLREAKAEWGMRNIPLIDVSLKSPHSQVTRKRKSKRGRGKKRRSISDYLCKISWNSDGQWQPPSQNCQGTLFDLFLFFSFFYFSFTLHYTRLLGFYSFHGFDSGCVYDSLGNPAAAQ